MVDFSETNVQGWHFVGWTRHMQSFSPSDLLAWKLQLHCDEARSGVTRNRLRRDAMAAEASGQSGSQCDLADTVAGAGKEAARRADGTRGGTVQGTGR
ncbi:hypothetical protein GUJ93_ZPchr0005g14781 [Zizania palustris]|uniref:Uncharacterized protein n=1 Tax=Zizania palustris TaxID=103762 RepID=A0A8J5S399_ZIZPA|nr:hypothetical protein GUJ93_ZPchr0005g14781 [Zizania palustris]